MAKVSKRAERTLPELGPAPAEIVTVQILNSLTCHWPVGDPKREDFHFCGRPKPERGPYCGHHAALAYR